MRHKHDSIRDICKQKHMKPKSISSTYKMAPMSCVFFFLAPIAILKAALNMGKGYITDGILQILLSIACGFVGVIMLFVYLYIFFGG